MKISHRERSRAVADSFPKDLEIPEIYEWAVVNGLWTPPYKGTERGFLAPIARSKRELPQSKKTFRLWLQCDPSLIHQCEAMLLELSTLHPRKYRPRRFDWRIGSAQYMPPYYIVGFDSFRKDPIDVSHERVTQCFTDGDRAIGILEYLKGLDVYVRTIGSKDITVLLQTE